MNRDSSITLTNLNLSLPISNSTNKFALQPESLLLQGCTGTIHNLIELLKQFNATRLVLDGRGIKLGYERDPNKMGPVADTQITHLVITNPDLDLIYAFFEEDLEELVLFQEKGYEIDSDALAIWLEARSGETNKIIIVCEDDSLLRTDGILVRASLETGIPLEFVSASGMRN